MTINYSHATDDNGDVMTRH